MAESYFVRLNRYQAPALVVMDGEQDDAETMAEVVLIPAVGDAVFYRCLHRRRAPLDVLRAAVLALAEDEACRRIAEQPADTRPDSVAFDPADLVAVAGRRSLLQQYPGIEPAANTVRLAGVRSLLEGVQIVRNVEVIDS